MRSLELMRRFTKRRMTRGRIEGANATYRRSMIQDIGSSSSSNSSGTSVPESPETYTLDYEGKRTPGEPDSEALPCQKGLGIMCATSQHTPRGLSNRRRGLVVIEPKPIQTGRFHARKDNVLEIPQLDKEYGTYSKPLAWRSCADAMLRKARRLCETNSETGY